MVSVDCVVWPSNAAHLQSCMTALHSILAMSPRNAAHLQMPVTQAQTLPQALLKHRRSLEDGLCNCNLDCTKDVALMFQKPANCGAQDKRLLVQPALLVTSATHESNSWAESSVALQNLIQDIPLIRVNEMIGYDAETGARPGASARVEQKLNQHLGHFETASSQSSGKYTEQIDNLYIYIFFLRIYSVVSFVDIWLSTGPFFDSFAGRECQPISTSPRTMCAALIFLKTVLWCGQTCCQTGGLKHSIQSCSFLHV